VAGPGTGKTRTLVERIARLLRTCAAAPDEITAITFTRKAATELLLRLAKLLGARADGVSVQTFHALGLICCGRTLLPLDCRQTSLFSTSRLGKRCSRRYTRR